jgi:hypothetical protein
LQFCVGPWSLACLRQNTVLGKGSWPSECKSANFQYCQLLHDTMTGLCTVKLLLRALNNFLPLKCLYYWNLVPMAYSWWLIAWVKLFWRPSILAF